MPGRCHQIGVGLQVGIAQQRHAALAAADKLARTPQLQVLAGDLETVGMLENDLQTLACHRRQGLGIEQDAGGLVGAAPDPAT